MDKSKLWAIIGWYCLFLFLVITVLAPLGSTIPFFFWVGAIISFFILGILDKLEKK